MIDQLGHQLRNGQSSGVLAHVHFYWIDRNQRRFEWFRDLLAGIERLDRGRKIDIRIHMTGGRSDATSAIVSLARELAYERGRPDPVTGVTAYTRMGYPNWIDELSAIMQRHAPDPVAVFFCGPRGLGRKVRKACQTLGLSFRQEQF